MPLTPSQREAIAARGNVIVVAGAGTGKTSTLVERCVTLVAEGCSMENILMVTFTEAAAAEMRHRLGLKLAEAAARDAADAPCRQHWEEQLALLDTARICTLHSFCLQLIRENFHLLGIDPAVKVLDEVQTRPLVEGALDACLEPHFAGTAAASEAVRELVRRYGLGDVERIRSLVLRLHRYAQSLAAPRRWFADQLAALEQSDPAAWRGWFESEGRAWASSWLPELEGAAKDAENLARCAQALRAMGAAHAGGPDLANADPPAAAALAEIVAADAAEWPKRQKTKLRDPFKKFFEEAAFLASQLEQTTAGDGLAADWANVRGSLAALVRLAQEFGVAYAGAKRDAGGIDFADLEQFALQLLRDESGQGTPVAQRWQQVLEHVFVDECQDINAAQDAILRAVSRETETVAPLPASATAPAAESPVPAVRLPNRFLVGDVKQSIYQFRLARPELFRGYERSWTEGAAGRRLLLSENFRSAPGIIALVNALFQPLMREDLGGVLYEPLVAARVDGLSTAPPSLPGSEQAGGGSTDDAPQRVEFHLIPKADAAPTAVPAAGEDAPEARNGDEAPDGRNGVEDLLAVEKEARLVALRLRDLHRSGLAIWDKDFKVLRRVEWRDMAVLLRSPSNRVEAFAQEFHKCGVPLQAARGGFLQATEITDLLSLLQVLDNPLQDIPLLAVLRSPLVALTLDELAEIRAASREERFWAALKQFDQGEARGGVPAAAAVKVRWFLEQYARWRELARQVSLSHCLEAALADSAYEAVLKADDRGAERVANVRKFVEMLRQYDPYQRQGLFRFLKFVAALEAAEQDLEPAPAQTQNAVRLMSIHQSKGLEFPVVVVACLGAKFNLGDLSGDVLLDEQFGLCAKAVQPQPGSGARHPTLAHWLAARRQRRQVLGEELRLLYVAATRARDRLLLTATATRKDCDAWESVAPRAFTSREMLTAQAPLDWLLLWLPTATRTEDWQGDGGAAGLLTWKVWTDPDALKLDDPTQREPERDAALGAGDPTDVARRIRWTYGFQAAVRESAKTSVTALRRQAEQFRDEDANPWRPKPVSAPSARTAAAAARAGTLHHRFLQRMSLHGACDELELRAQLGAMVQSGVFTQAEAAVLDLPALARFWQGAVGAEIRAVADAVRREVPFTARFTPAELARLTGAQPVVADEFVVVQGVADLVVVRGNELWLLDFKTDEVDAQGAQAKAPTFRPQLELYAAALTAIYRKPVTRRWLHFVRAGETVPV
jgi:ATP-dependent helicase/nuclease subunit A